MLGWLWRGKGVEASQRLIAKGGALERRGRLAEACEAYRSATVAAPGHAAAHLNLGVVLEALGRTDEAERAYGTVLELEPANPYASFNLGKLAYLRGQWATARVRLEEALRGKPEFAEAQVVLASVHEARGDADAALECLEAALRSRPGYAGALRNLGLLQARLGRWAQAEAALREAVSAEPDDADAQHWRGRALHHLGRLAEAAACLRDALRLRPDNAEILTHLGNVLCDLGRPAEARSLLARAVELQPGLADAHAGLGSAYALDKMMSEASQAYQRALALDPRLLHAHINLGNVLAGRGEAAEALKHFDAALALDPESAEARWCRAMAAIPALRDTPGELARSRARFADELAALERWFDPSRSALAHRVVGLRQPFWLTYQEERNVELLRAYGSLCARLMSAWPGAPVHATTSKRAPGRIRVGVVSQYFRNHSVWNAIVRGWFQHLDPGEFELSAFCLGGLEDAETRVARERSARFEQGPRSLAQWVDAIVDSRPDVLLYPEVGMDAMTAKLAALRLAPRQAACWGHPETTGMPTVDFYLSAASMEPPGAQANYTESLVELPNLGCHVRPEADAPAVTLGEFGLDDSLPLLICPGTPFKYAPEHDGLFPRIARELGDCRFVFFAYWTRDLTERLRGRLTRAFEAEGIDAGRHLRILPWLTRPAFLGLMRRADVFLDTVGFSGFNTALQSMQSGLPVVTLEGRFLRGRLASGVLRRIGLDDLVVQSEDEYVARAVRLCREAKYRDGLRARIAASRHLLYEDFLPIRALESFLRRA
jgi:protein O-GlcNAc transferase